MNVNTTVTFPSKARAGEYTAADFRLVGIPGSSEVPLAEVLLGTHKKDWQAYWDNGASSNYLVEYDGSNKFQFGAGKAFWILSKSQLNINRSVNFPVLNALSEVEISLTPGWNLITNPFAASIPWSRIQSANATSASIFSFNGSFIASTSFDPYIGYYYFNGSPGTTLSTLKIPYYSLYGSIGQPLGNTFEGWKVSISLSSPGNRMIDTWFGVSIGAKNGMDEFDLRKPRAVGTLPDLFFDRPLWDNQYSTFTSDVRPNVNSMEVWEFDIASVSSDPKTLTFSGIAQIPSLYEIILMDWAHSNYIDLRKDSTYTFTSPLTKLHFSVLVGLRDAVMNHTSELVPQEYSLSQNFPNPFNPSTSFRVSLPEISTIRLTIFNTLGQLVRTVYSGELNAGNYWHTWNGKNDRLASVPSGVYYCRLEVTGKRTYITKMLLVR